MYVFAHIRSAVVTIWLHEYWMVQSGLEWCDRLVTRDGLSRLGTLYIEELRGSKRVDVNGGEGVLDTGDRNVPGCLEPLTATLYLQAALFCMCARIRNVPGQRGGSLIGRPFFLFQQSLHDSDNLLTLFLLQRLPPGQDPAADLGVEDAEFFGISLRKFYVLIYGKCTLL